MILHCFHLAGSLTSLGAVRGETSATRASPVRRARQRSASRSAAFCHRPMSLCCQHIQLQGTAWHVLQRANKGDIDGERACVGLTRVPELTVAHIHSGAYWLKKSLRGLRAGSYDTTGFIRHCNQNKTKSPELCGETTRGLIQKRSTLKISDSKLSVNF